MGLWFGIEAFSVRFQIEEGGLRTVGRGYATINDTVPRSFRSLRSFSQVYSVTRLDAGMRRDEDRMSIRAQLQ